MTSRKKKQTKVSLNDFLGEGEKSAQGSSSSWADSTDDAPAYGDRDGDRDYDRRDNYDSYGDRGYDRGGRDNDRGYDRGGRDRDYGPPKELPTEPPFTAYIGNLSYDISQDKVKEFFEDAKLKVESVRVVEDSQTGRLKGFGYVEFSDLESLKASLDLNGEALLGRTLKIDIADGKSERGSRADTVDNWRSVKKELPPADERDGRGDSRDWRGDRGGDRGDRGYGGRGWGDRGDRGGDRGYDRGGDRGYDRGYDRGGDRGYDRGYDRGDRGGDRGYDRGYDRGDRGGDRGYDRGGDRGGDRGYDRPAEGEGRRERPKLNLKPRTNPAPVGAPVTSSKSNPFGQAKPRDESLYLKKKDEAKEETEGKAQGDAKPASE